MYVCGVCMYVCLYVCMYVCIVVRVCIPVGDRATAIHVTLASLQLLKDIDFSTDAGMTVVNDAGLEALMQVRVAVCMYGCMFVCVCMYACMHVVRYVCMYVCMFACM